MTHLPQQAHEDASSEPVSQNQSPLAFFVLVFVLYLPFIILGEVTGLQLFPGIPVAALAFVCPTAAASILAYRENGRRAVITLLRRSVDYERITAKRWYIPIVFLMPALAVLTYALMRVARLPSPTPLLSIQTALLMFLAFFVLAVGEEVGWMGYVVDPLQERWTALTAGILLGMVWAGLHIIPMMQAGQSLAFVAWACAEMVGIRILMVWLYNNARRSVFAIVLCHALLNLSTKSLFPGGSFDAERILTLIVLTVVIVVLYGWGAKTLARSRMPN